MNKDIVTASEARQSMQSGVMDCFTAFAMTGLFMESPSMDSGQAKARQSTPSESMDCFTAACPEPVEGFAMTASVVVAPGTRDL
jgi:hypothetical protein